MQRYSGNMALLQCCVQDIIWGDTAAVCGKMTLCFPHEKLKKLYRVNLVWCLDVTSCKRFGLSLAFASLHWSWAPLSWNQAQCNNATAACRITTSSDPNAAYGTRIFKKSARAALGLTELEVVCYKIATLFKAKQLVSYMFCGIVVKSMSSCATKKNLRLGLLGAVLQEWSFRALSRCLYCTSGSCILMLRQMIWSCDLFIPVATVYQMRQSL